MLKYDPLASMINAEIGERLRLAEQARLRRAAAQARLNNKLNNQSVSAGPRGSLAHVAARAARLWSSLSHELLQRGGPAPEPQPEK
jgi:hypothetical protein